MPDAVLGSLIDGRYKVVARLGAGGMADVYLAEDQQLGRKVALKLLHSRFAENPGFVERFRREAQAAAGLQHPNVVGVYDRGAYDGTYYIAMEYLPGRTLKRLISEEAPLDPVRAIDIAIQILKAARFAHHHGIIHRDLKPHNVIVDDSGHVKVTDFGIARAGASDMTETGSILGTAQYLSPEQAQGHAVSSSSDLYSIGVVLYEMLTARVPFDAEQAVTIAIKHVSEAPTAPTTINPRIPPELEQVVMWAMNKNPADRPRDADQFIAALEHAKAAIVSGDAGQRTAAMAAVSAMAGAGAGAAAAAAPGAAALGAPPPPTTLQPALVADGAAGDGYEAQRRRRRAWWWALAALIALLLAGGGVAAYLLTRPKQVVVPAVVGEQIGIARTQLTNAGFSVHENTPERNSHPAGTVFAQSPTGGAKADKGSTVTLTVSSGPGNVAVPGVIGEPLKNAENLIKHAGLTVGALHQQSSTTIPSGDVVNTSPSAGASVPVGSSVEIFVSSGKPLVKVPDVRGQAASSAKSSLESSGLKVQTSKQTSSSVPAGDVISQSPAGGSDVPAGSTVSLVVAKAPSTAIVPAVTGQTATAATSALKGAGFKVTETTQNTTKQNQDGKVLSENPSAGTSAKKGSSVTIVVGHYVAPTPTSTTPTTTTTTPTTTTTTTGK
jgi:beta-lactam-binding protein with PASTA domain/predicted Ser/Thr protein kinase